MNDYKKKYFIGVLGTHFDFQIIEDTWDKDVVGHDEIEEFLRKAQIRTLWTYVDEDNGRRKIRFQKELHNTTNNRVVIFTKIKPLTLNDENLISSLQVISLQGSPTTALYHTLNNVFSPLIVKNQKRNVNQNNIERQLANLQAGLRTTILSNNLDADPLKHVDASDLSGFILSLEHEIEFWTNAIQNVKSVDAKASYSSLRDILTPLSKEFSIVEALPLPEVEDLLENAHNVLDDLWRHEPPYPKGRMEHLMEIIASEVIKRLSRDIAKINFWTEDFNTTRDVLEQCLSTGNRWVNTCKQLTHIFWPNYSLHPWVGDYFVPMNLMDIVNGLQEIYDIRTIHRQLTRLLTTNEQEELISSKVFYPFKDLQVLNYGPHTEHEWRTAKKQFEYLLQPAEQRLAQKLKKQLSGIKANTRQLLYEYSRYSDLISRPTLKQALQNERQYLLEALREHVKTLANSSTETARNLSARFDTPQIICDISSARQMESRANEILSVSKKLLDDLQNYEDLIHTVIELLNNAKQQHNELFESWCTDRIGQIKNKSLSLKENDPVIQFSEDKLMRVSYSAELVSLIAEVRQLSAMGYSIPSSIEDIYVKAKKFMRYAKILEQIANFHNTIGDRMIPSQRPLMLSSAVNLSKLVQEEEVVYWSDIAAVEKYIDKLKAAVENLSSENNLLTNYHLQILEKIRDLENVDLIKQYQKWKDTAKNIRDIVSQVQNKGFKSMQSWRIDLDRQLAKVLEIQYLKSLHTVHLYLPEIYSDLIYRDGKLSYSPDEKNLREKYSNQMKRFLEIPKSFRGISDSHEIFAEIIDRSKYEIDKVNQNTDNLFEQLQSVLKHWESWLTLESLDNSKLTVWQDWDLHFRASKTFGQEIAKLPSTEEKVGCFIVGLVRLRNDLESHNRSYWDKLILSLKDSIAEDVVKLQIYVDSSTATLNRQPVTMEQIGEADASHANILRDRPQMEELYESMCLKAKTLAGWTREQIDSVNRLQAAWERLQSLLENHEHIISKQMQTVKTTLSIATENLNRKIESFGAKWDQVKPRPNSGQIAQDTLPQLHKYLENIKQKRVQWKELMEEKQKIIGDFEKFGMSSPEFLFSDEIDVDLTNMENTWSLFEEFYTDFEKLANEEWIVFRKKSYLLEEFLFDWQTKLQKLEPTPLVTRILKEIHNYQGITSTLKLVKGEDFTDKHWLEVYTLLRIAPKPIDSLYLKDFLNVSEVLQEKTKELQAICKKAAGEVVVRQALAELNHWEVQSHFALADHLDCKKRNIFLIKDFKEILNKIGDNQSLLQSVKNAADFDSFSEQAGIWENRLTDLENFLTNLAQIQRKWVYLEPIFGSGTLNHEAARFERLDRDFRNVLNFIEKDSRVCALLRYSNLRSVLENLQDQLVRCQKSLDEFLTEKRNKFPRFLFLGDNDLLEVVGQSSQENVIQSHLKKLFAGIHSIKLDKQGCKIVEMRSLEGETVELNKPVDVSQPIEIWLNLLVDAMQASLRSLLNKCLADGQNLDPSKYPSQILCLADSITFTNKCEQAINSMTLPPLLATYKTQLSYYSSLELQSDSVASAEQENNSNVLELKLKALLLDTIHHINVIEELIDDNVTKTMDWTWQKQLRFYVKSTGDVTVKMANAEMEYSFEYLGNGQKLVRTPLTERCFLTLTQGMFLGMGGNPYGPAGTGKTESVKALGGLLGRQVLVFNCDEGIDASSMGRIISGLVKTGAWGCFDEFNRLDEATLSAISMYIQPIQLALKNRNDTVILLEQEIKVNKHCGIFVTLNPAGGSYGGRNKLPDNLKQLFRPVVMTHPDHEQIARTLLHCNGYKKADVIAGKLVEIFKLSNLLLSKQQHYDWGLRALKTVLNGCSQGKREYKKSINSNDPADNHFEFAIVTKALKMDTLSKLTFCDHQKFEALVTDVFQEIPKEIVGDKKFREILEEACQELGLYTNERQMEKCLELHEQLKQRMGVAIVGPPSSGKSTVKKILLHALNKMGHTLKEKVFNPKSLPRAQLLGQIDSDTRQWSDGVLSLYSLQVTSEPQNVWSWITCDGDIDPEWVESLNSVLDDNRLLSLPSGWRIQFGPNVNFIFETHELRNASPATISRMGIVFFSEEVVTVEDYVTNAIRGETENSGVLESFYNDYFFKAVNWILSEGELVIPCSKIGVVTTALSQLKGVSNRAEFTVNLINGLSGQLQEDFKEIFAQQIFSWTGEIPPSDPERIRYNKEQGTIENYTVKHNQIFEKSVPPLVQTVPVRQALDILGKYLKRGEEQHFLLIGPHGSAKSLIIEHLIKTRSEVDLAIVHCSAHVTPQYLIHKFKQNCIIVNSSKGRVFKPKKGHLVMYFKNLQLLKPDRWGTNILIEFLQQRWMAHARCLDLTR
ncbi:btv [Trypoxylus dichotomus]